MELDKPEFFPFAEAENDTLQVLLKEFVIRRVGEGSRLIANFDHTTPTIRRRESRSILQSAMEQEIYNFNATCDEIQEKIDALLIDRTSDEFSHPNESFIFRYCSGGTLPILAIDGIDYYCLFLRDIKPYGWNIANGSTDTLPELLDPSITIRRELREELIAVDPCNMVDYTFIWDTEPTVNRPEFDDARRMIANLDGFAGISQFDKSPRVVHTSDGFDSVDATYWSASNKQIKAEKPVRGCYLNINAEDFGIEIDHIGRIELPKGISLIDGEINGNNMLNRPIGLFRVKEFNPDSPGEPNMVFQSGKPLSLDNAINRFSSHVIDLNIRDKNHVRTWLDMHNDDRFRLCPVTRQIVRRHQRYLHQPRPGYVHEQSMIAFMFELCSRAGQIFRPNQFFDQGIDGHIEWVTSDGVVTGKRIYVQLKSGHSHLRSRGDTQVFDIKKERHIQYWRDQDSDVYLVIRTERDGTVQWMNISKALRAHPCSSVKFDGTELNVHSLLEIRDQHVAR